MFANEGAVQDGKEFVEGVKITGDANVPAGRVSFKACISSDSKMPSTRYLPPELGIRARYKGQGQVAEVGFKNPRQVSPQCPVLCCLHPTRSKHLPYAYSTGKQLVNK